MKTHLKIVHICRKFKNLKQFEQFSEYVEAFQFRLRALFNEFAIRNMANYIFVNIFDYIPIQQQQHQEQLEHIF